MEITVNIKIKGHGSERVLKIHECVANILKHTLSNKITVRNRGYGFERVLKIHVF